MPLNRDERLKWARTNRFLKAVADPCNRPRMGVVKRGGNEGDKHYALKASRIQFWLSKSELPFSEVILRINGSYLRCDVLIPSLYPRPRIEEIVDSEKNKPESLARKTELAKMMGAEIVFIEV